MSDCRTIDPLITPYVDGDIGAADRLRVDDHVRRCPPCHSRVTAERAVRDLVHARRVEIAADTASPALRARCAALRGASVGISRWRTRMKPLALAAGVILVVGGVVIYQATDRSTRLLAAELTADHVKCFGVVNTLIGTNANAAAVEQVMTDVFGWQMHVPEATGEGLELIGARPCFYGRGKAAHLMYRHHGQALSVFMLPQPLSLARRANHADGGTPEIADAPEMIDVMGHEAAVWSKDGRTYVLVAREPEDEVERAVSAVQASLH